MIQILDKQPERVIPVVHQMEPCVLCGGRGWTSDPVRFKPYVSAGGKLRFHGGRYDILYCHDTCFNNTAEPLDYVLRQRGGVPHSFSQRN